MKRLNATTLEIAPSTIAVMEQIGQVRMKHALSVVKVDRTTGVLIDRKLC